MTDTQYREKAFRILEILRRKGYVEYWPPSPYRWFFKRPTGDTRLVFNWSTCRVEVEHLED